eukprot:scaffold10954_cov74-Cyclotella_meneghiniana.AAC.3
MTADLKERGAALRSYYSYVDSTCDEIDITAVCFIRHKGEETGDRRPSLLLRFAKKDFLLHSQRANNDQ